MRKPRLYLETSVWNFYFADDAPDKKDITKEFFGCVKQDRYNIFISQTVLNEIDRADEHKKNQLLGLIKEYRPQELDVNQEVTDLAKEYISQKILPETKVEDALHAATSAVYEMDALLSWNNRHLANLFKMEKINGINLMKGYTKHLEIITPMEVITDED
ncbi:MAG: type II toxin-antitoxin system VapC family toxin [bacterium]